MTMNDCQSYDQVLLQQLIEIQIKQKQKTLQQSYLRKLEGS